MKTVFIHGAAGTTGLRIHERLAGRKDLSLLILPEEERKNPEKIRQALNDSDVAFLCLPDDAAREAVEMVENPDTVLLDTSTAHRTMESWAYGFPELSGAHREKIAAGKRIAVPGCHASGFIALIYPLVEAGLILRDTPLTCFSLTGYSGGGKKMIAQYENPERSGLLKAPRQYALSQNHKHLKEMTVIPGLSVSPVFCPIVADFYSGMEVTVSLFARDLKGTPEDVRVCLGQKYASPVLHYLESDEEEGFASAARYSGLDSMTVSVTGNAERLLLTARYDNLGKGASGAAIQCMNLVLSLPETEGLELE